MSTVDKVAIMARVETLTGRKRQTLSELVIPRSTYYRWRQGQPASRNRKRPWNRITPEEEDKIVAAAMESPEISSRQLAAWIRRQRRLCHIRVNGVPYSTKVRAGETPGDETHSL